MNAQKKKITCWQYAIAMLLKSLDERFSRFSSNLLLFIFNAKLARSISAKKSNTLIKGCVMLTAVHTNSLLFAGFHGYTDYIMSFYSSSNQIPSSDNTLFIQT